MLASSFQSQNVISMIILSLPLWVIDTVILINQIQPRVTILHSIILIQRGTQSINISACKKGRFKYTSNWDLDVFCLFCFLIMVSVPRSYAVTVRKCFVGLNLQCAWPYPLYNSLYIQNWFNTLLGTLQVRTPPPCLPKLYLGSETRLQHNIIYITNINWW